MRFTELAPGFFVAGQIDTADVSAAAEQGIRKIICNRPDGEAPDQTPSGELAAAAQSAGVGFDYVPLSPGGLSEQLVAAFGVAIGGDGPVLAYCRSGMRSATLWALSRVGELSVDDVVHAAGDAGYDLTGMRPMLEAKAAATD